MLRNKKALPSVADKVFDELLDSQKKLRSAIAAGTEAAVVQTKAEEERKQTLQLLQGNIQSIATGIGELVTSQAATDELTTEQHQIFVNQLQQLEDFIRGFSLFMGGEMREEMNKLREEIQKMRVMTLEVSELLALALRGWTAAAMLADAQGLEVPKPPGYSLEIGADDDGLKNGN